MTAPVERPLCMACGGTCYRLWEHFGEGEDPSEWDEDDIPVNIYGETEGEYADE